jgi:hypothetical protein
MEKTYRPLKRCVYCGSAQYASDSKRYLAEEHIIPYGLNGDLVIPEASCRSCERITGRQESIMLKGALQGVRSFLGLKSRNPKDKPKVLPLFWGNGPTNSGKRLIDVKDFPAIFLFFHFSLPSLIGGPTPPTMNVSINSLRMDANLIHRKYGLKEFSAPSTDMRAFCRMLAKIAHSYSVAELGLDNFSAHLVDYILATDDAEVLRSHIGGNLEQIPPSNELHEIGFYDEPNYPNLVIVRLRLFAKYGGPAYLIVVGEKNNKVAD